VAAAPPPRHPGPWFGQNPLARRPQGPRREGFVRGVPRTWQEALGLPPPSPSGARDEGPPDARERRG